MYWFVAKKQNKKKADATPTLPEIKYGETRLSTTFLPQSNKGIHFEDISFFFFLILPLLLSMKVLKNIKHKHSCVRIYFNS